RVVQAAVAEKESEATACQVVTVARRKPVDRERHADFVSRPAPARSFENEPTIDRAIDLGKCKGLGFSVIPACAHEHSKILSQILLDVDPEADLVTIAPGQRQIGRSSGRVRYGNGL